MDEITDYCARFLSADFERHADAYRWLNHCQAFQGILRRFKNRDKSIFDVAAMLAQTDHELHGAAVYLLAVELGERSAAGNCEAGAALIDACVNSTKL